MEEMNAKNNDTTVDSKESTFLNKIGLKVFCRSWNFKDQKPKKLVFICHGMGEHSGRYKEIVDRFLQQGFFVFTHDHVGHGRSEGDRVHVDDFKTFVDDVVQHVTEVKNNFPECPCFIVGHSMGGTITILAGLDHPDLFKGAVILAPAIQVDPLIVTPLKRFLARALSWVLPQMVLGGVSGDMVTRNKEKMASYKEDPLCWKGGVKSKFGSLFLDVFTQIEERRSDFKLPYLLLHGTDDKICLIEGSTLFHQHTSSLDKTFTEYNGAYHQLLSEPDGQGEEAINQLTTWICSRCENTPAINTPA